MVDRLRVAYVGTIAVLVAAVLWLVRPLLHGPLLFLYANPAVLEAILVVVVGTLVASRLAGGGILGAMLEEARSTGEVDPTVAWQASTRPLVLVAAVLVVGVLFVALPTLGNAFAQEHVSTTLAVDDVDELPEADADRPRILPRRVARQYAANSLQYPRYQLAVGDVAIRNGTPTWSFGLAPDGGVNELVLTGKGGAFVDMTTTAKRVSVVEEDPTVGFGLGLGGDGPIVSEYRWRLAKGKFAVTYEDAYVVDHEGDVYIAVPYVRYDHHVRFAPLPVVYATPEWGGTALVAPDGSIEFLTPEEARSHPALADQRLFPFDLARYYVESMRYGNGVVNKWFVHEDELEVAPVPGDGNEQPFFAMTEEGMRYFVAAEPYGEAHGIYQIWSFDGRTGDANRLRLPIDSALMGPARAADFVRKANDRTDWDRFNPSEPVPVVVDGRLHWQVRVVPNDASGVAYTAFIDASSGDVYTTSSDDGIRTFLRTGQLTEGEPDRPSVDGQNIVVRVVGEDGTVVDSVTVGEGQRIEIEYENATTTSGRLSPPTTLPSAG